jgi:hypothetical protein
MQTGNEVSLSVARRPSCSISALPSAVGLRIRLVDLLISSPALDLFWRLVTHIGLTCENMANSDQAMIPIH